MKPHTELEFWALVDKQEQINDCWLWLGPISHGYGRFTLVGERKTHRISWVLHYGPIPNGLYILHLCDNKPCVNPQHLQLGTQSENIRQAVERGRHARAGGASPASKAATSKRNTTQVQCPDPDCNLIMYQGGGR